MASWKLSLFFPSALNFSSWILSFSFFISVIIFLAFSWLIPSFNSLTCWMVAPAALFEFLIIITLGSTFLLIRWICNNSFAYFNSSGFNVVIILSFLSIEILSPLKLYRLPISLKQLARVLSHQIKA